MIDPLPQTLNPQLCLQELSAERAIGDADLGRKLGTLRYLKGLQAARQRALAAATPDAASPPPFVYSKGGRKQEMARSMNSQMSPLQQYQCEFLSLLHWQSWSCCWSLTCNGQRLSFRTF